ncbi:MAG: hypothetical protein ACREJ0_30015 [Geminicoccaceae bacterium]
MADAEPDNGTRTKSYHEALGLFMEEFAKTEGFLRMLLFHYAQVSGSVGKAAFPSTSVDQTITLISNITLVNDPGEPRRSDLDVVFQQLKSINQVRNSIVHFLPLDGIPGDVRHLTNAMRALTEKHRRDIAVCATMLTEMTDDLQKVQAHIWYHLSFDRIPEFAVAMLDEVRRPPWRYQAPRQIKGTKSPRKSKRRENVTKREAGAL